MNRERNLPVQEEMLLRVHHILCLPLFMGEGYSDSFSKNMAERKRWLEQHPDEKLRAVCRPDRICTECPNLIMAGDGYCRNGDNHAAVKDRTLLKLLELQEESLYSWKELLETAVCHVRKADFDATCRNCQWYKEGLCSYEKWQRKVLSLKKDFLQLI